MLPSFYFHILSVLFGDNALQVLFFFHFIKNIGSIFYLSIAYIGSMLQDNKCEALSFLPDLKYLIN